MGLAGWWGLAWRASSRLAGVSMHGAGRCQPSTAGVAAPVRKVVAQSVVMLFSGLPLYL